MKLSTSTLLAFLGVYLTATTTTTTVLPVVAAFAPSSLVHHANKHYNNMNNNMKNNNNKINAALHVSIGLGPDQKEEDATPEKQAGIDYEIPNHEDFRLSRRSRMDEQCDAWFHTLLHAPNTGILGHLADDMRTILNTPVPLGNDYQKPIDSPEWTPYVSTKLPWTPLTPAYGLEQFGLPVPRRNAETWRHFDVAGMIAQDYSLPVHQSGTVLDDLDPAALADLRSKLVAAGGWLQDDACRGRLVYLNGRFVPQLSVLQENLCTNLAALDDAPNQTVRDYLARLTDGHTDALPAAFDNGSDAPVTLQSKLSAPDHCVGSATTQFAINTQQGTACFAALNTIHTGAVAYVHATAATTPPYDETVTDQPVLVVNAVSANGGADPAADAALGVTCHPRLLIVADADSRLSVVQSSVDLDAAYDPTDHRAKLYNGYTQIFVGAGANVSHSCLEESGGIVTPGVELADADFAEGVPVARQVEAQRPELKDTHLETVDVHIVGNGGNYKGTLMNMGGSGRVRLAMAVSLLKAGAHAAVNGFSLSGGAQRADVKTTIQHVAQGTTSKQVQKNMIGGRSTGSFRGRIRVEQSAQQTDSQQLSRTILLSDKCRAWAVPSLEIIADDVKCTHGATVSDLSEEELFYLRSRGLNRALSRNLLMYAFAGDVSGCVDPAMLEAIDSQSGLQQRIIRRLENLVPQGERAIRGEFQSS